MSVPAEGFVLMHALPLDSASAQLFKKIQNKKNIWLSSLSFEDS